jgi:hypothetical protein
MVGSARARLGYTGWLNNTMFFITGGAAWANTEYTALFQTFPPLNQANHYHQERVGGRGRG